ncbi:sigma-54-dependent transcriptional regulator [Cobetia crustatorum]|uniref:Sigma-54-dependent Fis family transcriptional regulator n=1 Tax=Cobetia crustatorum TaxID=553385 RepID=A0A558HSL6_9GAMM|nr:sigma-54 dependent transcriptional regulator [Cobetia crustatorum]TVU72094.1 sigma-54-dependent Fis family transcriptional regulator [Cobetia crustatorum]
MARILIVEKEGATRNTLQHLLEREGHGVVQASGLEDAYTQAPADFALVICDIALAGEHAEPIIQASRPTPVILLADTPSMHAAIASLKAGAIDYLPKPFDQDVFARSVREALSLPRDAAPLLSSPAPPSQRLASHPGGTGQPVEMIGHCRAMQQVYTRIRKVAPADVTVLVLGESGTGKELVARAIHRQSDRHQAPLICVNCAAIPETLIESELFGHEKGAFTGATSSRTGLIEAADGGTLFLDEIGELPLDAQARLLRVLQEGEIRRVGAIETRYVDIRLIAATHRNLHQLSSTGGFRLDLYYRLNVMEIDLPPLRERGDDVLVLAEHLLDGIARKHGRDGMRLSQRARQEIHHYAWPGNVRELENALERGVILADRRIIAPEDLGLRGPSGLPPEASHASPMVGANSDNARQGSNASTASSTTGMPAPAAKLATSTSSEASRGSVSVISDDSEEEDLSLEDYFQHFVLEHQDHMSETELARRLGISRKNLWERRQRLGIPRRKGRRGTPSA